MRIVAWFPPRLSCPFIIPPPHPKKGFQTSVANQSAEGVFDDDTTQVPSVYYRDRFAFGQRGFCARSRGRFDHQCRAGSDGSHRPRPGADTGYAGASGEDRLRPRRACDRFSSWRRRARLRLSFPLTRRLWHRGSRLGDLPRLPDTELSPWAASPMSFRWQ